VSWAVYAFHEEAERIIGFGPFVSGCDGAAVERHVDLHEGWSGVLIHLRPAVDVEQALAEALEASGPDLSGIAF